MPKTSRARGRTRKEPILPDGWTLPALVDRRRAPRPAKESATQKARAMTRRRKSP